VENVEVVELLPWAIVEKALGAVLLLEDEAIGEEIDNALENLWTNPSWAQRLDAAFADMMILFCNLSLEVYICW